MSWKQPIPTDLINICNGHKFATTVLEKLLLRAKNKPGFYYFEGQQIYLERGECFCGRFELAEWFGLKKNQSGRIARVIAYLQKAAKQIDKRKTQNGSIITILYYDKYTTLEQTNEQLTDKRRTNDRHKQECKEVKPCKDIYTPGKSTAEISSIFEFWNSKKIITHRNLEKFKPVISGCLKNYSPEEIKQAINNFSEILKDTKYYWTHKWTLDEFLSRKGGLDKFMNSNKPHEQFKVKSRNYNTQQAYTGPVFKQFTRDKEIEE